MTNNTKEYQQAYKKKNPDKHTLQTKDRNRARYHDDPVYHKRQRRNSVIRAKASSILVKRHREEFNKIKKRLEK